MSSGYSRKTNVLRGIIATSLVIALNVPGGDRGALAQDPSEVGQWNLLATPVKAHYEMVLPTGKILSWGLGSPENRGTLWDPADGSFTANPSPRGIKCTGYALLPDGRSLVAKGCCASYEVIFDPFTENWIQVASMAHDRFYPTFTNLPDGRALLSGGESNVPEIYDPITNTWEQLNAAPMGIPEYPRMFVLPSGLVFLAGASGGMTWTLDLETETWQQVGDCLIGFQDDHWRPAVAFEPGKILICGGGSGATGTNDAALIDFNQPTPTWQLTASMNATRRNHNATMLPDGKVLVIGGKGILTNEVFNPVDQTWTMMASMEQERGPHSTALLLPDGRVATRRDNSTVLQIYSPPYLFKGVRPSILTSPDSIGYGNAFTVGTDVDLNSIGSVALLRPSSATHSFDMGQLYIQLEFTASGGTLVVSAPGNANLAPPGYYMLFIVSATGVPSIARFVQLAEAAPCPWDCGGGASTDGTVGIVDFLALLAQWGDPGSCDFDGDGVDIDDFLALLNNWGPCP